MKIFYSPGDSIGCAWYRMHLPARYMKKYYDTVCRANPSLDDHDLNDADMIIVQMEFNPIVREFLQRKKEQGKKIVYEIDDNVWHVIDGSPRKSIFTKHRLYHIERIIRLSHAVITTTKPLADILQRFNEKVYIIPNYIEKSMNIEKSRQENESIRIGFAGGDTHNVDFTDEIIQALLDIRELYKDDVEIIFFGYIPEVLIGKVSYQRAVESSKYLDMLAYYNFDIGIIPCIDHPFNECKSNIKYLEYSAVGAVTVASPVYPYRQSITDKTGIVLKDNSYESWRNALTNLIENEQYRKRITQNANEDSQKYLIEDHIQYINEVYWRIRQSA